MGLKDLPVEGWQGRVVTRTGIHVHLIQQHVQDTMKILDEGNLPHPWCPLCDMLLPWSVLNARHPNTVQCAKGAERKQRRLSAEEMRSITEWDL